MNLATQEIIVAIDSDADIVTVRARGKVLAAGVGFSSSDAVLFATAISELARNIIRYAGRGEIVLRTVQARGRNGVQLTARDEGPGITNIDLAMQAGYSTSGGFGLGLPGVKRLMDEFSIESRPGEGLTVIATKWRR